MQLEAVILKDVLPHLTARMTYVRRFGYAGVTSLVVAVGGAGASYGSARQQSATGSILFDVMLWVILVTGLIECTFLGATSVSSERQRNTVDVWILAGMEHFSMVATKALSVLTRTAAVVAAPVVPAAVALYLGGRTITDAAVAFLAVVSIMVFTTALTVSVSSFYKRNSDSVPAAIAAMLGFAVAPAVVLEYWAAAKTFGSAFAGWLLGFHPFALLWGIGEVRGAKVALTAFWGLCLSVLASLVLLAIAGARLRAGEPAGKSGVRPFRALDRLLERMWPRFFHLFKPLPGNPDEDPVGWRERIALANSKGLFGAMTVSDKLLAAGAGLAVLAFVAANGYGARRTTAFISISTPSPTVLGLFVAVSLAALMYRLSFLVKASQAFSKEFESGHMDLIRLTRLTGEEIVNGKTSVYARLYTPAIIVAGVWFVVMLADMILSGNAWPRGVLADFGVHWVMVLGWAFAGLSATGVALFSSLFFSSGTRAMYASVLLYAVPVFVVYVLTLPFYVIPSPARLIVQLVFGLLVVTRIAYWSRTHRGYVTRQECLIVMVVTCFGAAVSGPVLGAISIYVLTRTLMRVNFDKLVVHAGEQHRVVVRLPALSYERAGVYAFTHLGVPPSIERALLVPYKREKTAIGGLAPGASEKGVS